MSTPTPVRESKREIELDFTRGIAILLAMGWHFNQAPTGFGPLDVLLWPGRAFGWAGVDLFFVLSGFLVGRLIFLECQRRGEFDARKFLIRRAFKIWPILYVFIALRFLLIDRNWRGFVPQTLLHVQNFWETPIHHLWSLAVEEHFYLAFALIIALLNGRRQVRWHWVAIVSGAIFVVCLGLRMVAASRGVDPYSIQHQTQYRLDGLATGVTLAALYVFARPRFDQLLEFRAILLLTSVLAWWVVSMHPLTSPVTAVIGYPAAMLASATFLLFCYGNPLLTRRSALVRSVSAIGVFSYAMYIWHPSMLRISTHVIQRLPPPVSTPLVRVLVMYAGSIIAAVVMTRAIEWPFLWLRERLFPAGGGSVSPIAEAPSEPSMASEAIA